MRPPIGARAGASPKRVVVLPKLATHFRKLAIVRGASMQYVVNEALCQSVGHPEWLSEAVRVPRSQAS